MVLLRHSYTAIVNSIPDYHMRMLHIMYEDQDLHGRTEAEDLITYIEEQDPGTFIGILADDTVSPPCVSEQGHYPCQHYDEYTYIFLISTARWEQYKEIVYQRDKEHQKQHQCKVGLTVYLSSEKE